MAAEDKKTSAIMLRESSSSLSSSAVDQRSLSSTTPPTLTERRDGFRRCEGVEATEGSTARESVTIEFSYEIELDADSLSVAAEQDLIDVLSNEIVASVHDSSCGGRRRRRRRLIRQGGRQLAIESIASGSFTTPPQPCEPIHENSVVCQRYEGMVLVGYTQDGNKDSTPADVGSTVLGQISSDMENDVYLEAVNSELWILGPKVTTFRYGGSDFMDQFVDNEVAGAQSGYFMTDESGLTTLGKAMLPVLGLLFIAMLFAVFLMRKAQRKLSKKGEENSTLESDSAGDRGLHNIHTDSDESLSSSNITPELGTQHNPDVARCNKPNCSACSRRWLHKIDEEDPNVVREEEETDYGQSIETKVLPISNRSAIFRSIFQRSNTLPPIEVVPASFEEEPPSVKFVKVDDPHLACPSRDDTKESYISSQATYSDDEVEPPLSFLGYYSSETETDHTPGESTFTNSTGSRIMRLDMAGTFRHEIEI